MSTAKFTDIGSGKEISIDTNEVIVGCLAKYDGGTVITRHVPKETGGFVHEEVTVKESFFDVIDALSEARAKQARE